MHIAILTTQFPGARMGGIGSYTLRAASALADAGHHARIFTLALPADARAAVPKNVTLHEVDDLATAVATGALPPEIMPAILDSGEAMYRLATARQLRDAVAAVHAATPFDVIEAPDYEALALPLLLWPLPGPRPAIITHLHSGSAINRLGNDLRATPEDDLIDAFEAAAICAADAVMAPTRAVVAATKAALLDGGPLDAAVLPLPMSVPDTPFSEPPANGPVLFVGRIERLKGAQVLGGAIPKVLGRFENLCVDFVGPDTPTGPGGTSMVAAIAAGVPEVMRGRVRFLGERPAAEVAARIRDAACVVIPSLYENFSQVACEALAAGRVVVCSTDIGPAEFVGEGGVTFARGDSHDLAATLCELLASHFCLAARSRRAHTSFRRTLAAPVVTPARVAFFEECVARVRNSPNPPLESRLARLPARFRDPVARVAAGGLEAFAGERLAGLPPTPGMRLLRVMDSLGANSRVVLYGAGRHTTRLLAERHRWQSRGHAVVALIDDHPRFAAAAVHLGLPVMSRAAAEAAAARGDLPAVVLSTDTFMDQFYRQTEGLRTLGVRVERLY